MIDYTRKLISEPDKFHTSYMVPPGTTKSKVARFIARNLYWALPGYVWLLRRGRVTPAKRGRGGQHVTIAEPEEPTPAERRAAMTWAQRLKRVFGIDIETCVACGGATRRQVSLAKLKSFSSEISCNTVVDDCPSAIRSCSAFRFRDPAAYCGAAAAFSSSAR